MKLCEWCQNNPAPACGRFCCQKCRQSAFRCRRRRQTEIGYDRPMHFLYADPPYPGKAKKYYSDQTNYVGEVNHPALIESLRTSGHDGWALSTSAEALRDILPLCPKEARVCAWVKPRGVQPTTFGPENVWEPVIVVPGRLLRPGVADALTAQAARYGGDLPGRKPIKFCTWLFDLLGMLPGDDLIDMFPGTGIVSTCWREISHSLDGKVMMLPGLERSSTFLRATKPTEPEHPSDKGTAATPDPPQAEPEGVS